MRTYVYTEKSGIRQVWYADDEDAVALILQTASIMGHVVGERTWTDGQVRADGTQEEIRLITLTPQALNMQGHIMVMSDVMQVAIQLTPGMRIWL